MITIFSFLWNSVQETQQTHNEVQQLTHKTVTKINVIRRLKIKASYYY